MRACLSGGLGENITVVVHGRSARMGQAFWAACILMLRFALCSKPRCRVGDSKLHIPFLHPTSIGNSLISVVMIMIILVTAEATDSLDINTLFRASFNRWCSLSSSHPFLIPQRLWL
jgi:hypothetical protein